MNSLVKNKNPGFFFVAGIQVFLEVKPIVFYLVAAYRFEEEDRWL